MALIDNIRGCWSPALGATGNILIDRSAYRRHAILQNMDPGTDWVATAQGLALDFDGTDDLVNTGTSVPEVQQGSEVTLSMWGARASATTRIFFGRNGLNTLYVTPWSDGNIYTQNGGTGITFADNRAAWTHWCMTQGSGTQRLYRNGQQVASVTATGQSTSTQPFVIGGIITSGQNFPGQGKIGECVVWTSELKAADVLELYRRGSGGVARMLTGQSRRPVYGKAPSFRAAWATRRSQIIGGGLR